MNKHLAILVGTALAMAALAGCGSSDPSGTPGSSSSTAMVGEAVSVPAGAPSVALGVDHWQIASGTTVRGYDPAGNVIAEFQAHADNRTIESVLPDTGIKAMPAGSAANSMTPRSTAYLSAFMTDLKARVDSAASAAATGMTVDKTAYGCYATYNDCDVAGFQGILNGWWSAYSCDFGSAYACGTSAWTLDY